MMQPIFYSTANGVTPPALKAWRLAVFFERRGWHILAYQTSSYQKMRIQMRQP